MNVARFVKKDNLLHIGKTLRYSLYVITHPLDGFWDLTHEKRGSVAAANIIVILALLTTALKVQYSSFLVYIVQWEYFNLFEELLGFLIPIILARVANWALTTLFDGKGTMKQIYMAMGYALTPYVIIGLPMTFISNLMTSEELVFYSYITTFSEIWCGLLIISAVMMIHDYTLGKAIVTIVATVAGVMLMVFIFLLFFSLVTDAVAYFISLYKEIVYRLY
jgi:hypothetical protein